MVAQRLKRLPSTRETWVRSLSREDPLEKVMATHSSILAWRILWTEEPGGLWSDKEAKSQKTQNERGTETEKHNKTFKKKCWETGKEKKTREKEGIYVCR